MLANNNNKNEEQSKHYEVQDSFPFAQLSRPLLAANCSEYAVAHSNIKLQPARQMAEVSFLPHILYAMRRLRLTQLLRVQSYAWPYLKQGMDHGGIIVSAPRSGRTLSYVPPLCEVVCAALLEQRSRKRWELMGPIALVLAADLTRVQQIGSLCNAMLRKAKNEEWLSLVLTVPSADTPEFWQRWLNGVGCLVATPAQLLWLRSCELIKFSDLKFIVYDDVDLMQQEQLQQAHQQLLLLSKKQQPQLVITSQSFNYKLLQMLREFNSHSMLLFGDILEAAIYGGVKMRLLLLKSHSKQQELLQLLQQRSPLQLRTVINCQTDAEIHELVELLESNGYNCLPYYQTADLEVRDQVHRWMQQTAGKLLLCTDECPELDIRHAHTLIHYSLSDSWSKFKLRHLALADNLRNQFATKLSEEARTQDKHLEQDGLLSLVFLDESNNKQLPRLVDFLQMHQQVDERVLQLSRRIRDQLESLKCNEPALCDLLLSLGHCGDTLCTQRHQLLTYDRVLPSWLPSSGDVKLQLVRVYSPTHYCVRLLEHLPTGGSWQPVSRFAGLEMKLQLLQAQECLRHWPPKPKDICAYRNDYGYERVRVLHVAPIDRMNLSRLDVAVEVQAMDVDTRQLKTISGKLYICPKELLNAPPLAINLRILGMVPFTGERCWHEQDALQCANWLSAVPQSNFLQANIVRSLSHTIFVHNLAAISYAPSLQMHVRRFSMCQQLISSKLAKKCDRTIDKLMKFLSEVAQQSVGREVEFEEQTCKQQTSEELILSQQKSREPKFKQEMEKKEQKSEEEMFKELIYRELRPKVQMSEDLKSEDFKSEQQKFEELNSQKEKQSAEQKSKEKKSEEQNFREQNCQDQQKLSYNTNRSNRMTLFAKLALKLGKENRLCLAAKQQQEKQQQLNENSIEIKEPDNSIAALYNCLMNCSLLDLQEQQEQQEKRISADNSHMPEALLKQIIEPQKEQQTMTTIDRRQLETTKLTSKTTKTTALVAIEKSLDIQYETPLNVVRAEVIYYQTLCTLELQVELPEEKMPYEAALLNGSCISFWLTDSSKYQFIVNTHCAYQSLTHHVQGRTVYLSILKSLAITYPLDFSFYKFMKPQHDKLNRLEEERRARVANFETYLLHKGYIQGRSMKYTNEEHELSSDDQAELPMPEATAERVERAIDRAEVFCD